MPQKQLLRKKAFKGLENLTLHNHMLHVIQRQPVAHENNNKKKFTEEYLLLTKGTRGIDTTI